MKKTKWFNAGVKPELVGVYETNFMSFSKDDPSFQYWNGTQWGEACFSVDTAFRWKDSVSMQQKPRWRGLAQDPNAA